MKLLIHVKSFHFPIEFPKKSQPVTSASQRKHNILFHICIITAAGQECEGTYKAQRTNKEVSAPAFF